MKKCFAIFALLFASVISVYAIGTHAYDSNSVIFAADNQKTYI